VVVNNLSEAEGEICDDVNAGYALFRTSLSFIANLAAAGRNRTLQPNYSCL
jgi:hypothetical protein